MIARWNVVAVVLVVLAAAVIAVDVGRVTSPVFWVVMITVAGAPMVFARRLLPYRLMCLASAVTLFIVGGLGALNGGTLLWPAAVVSIIAANRGPSGW